MTRATSFGTRWSCFKVGQEKKIRLALIAVFLLLAVTFSACSGTATEAGSVTSSASRETDGQTSATPTAESETKTPSTMSTEKPTQEPTNPAGETAEISAVEISFDYTHTSTMASNQLAIWVEDENGALVKTVFVTDFTAGRRGYRNREMTLSHWVAAAEPEHTSDAELDAVSSATPSTGRLTYTWDLTDEAGVRVPDGVYYMILEGTLYWESNVLYTTRIDTTDFTPGDQTVTSERSQAENHENEAMVQNVAIKVLVP